MRGAEHVEHGEADLGGAMGCQGALFTDELGERGALDELHDDPRAAVLVDDVEDGDGAAAADPGNRLGFAQGAGDEAALLVLVDAGAEAEFLDGDRPAEGLVLGAPDGAHAALAEDFAQPVAPVSYTHL